MWLFSLPATAQERVAKAVKDLGEWPGFFFLPVRKPW
jgi:hypothetical protein